MATAQMIQIGLFFMNILIVIFAGVVSWFMAKIFQEIKQSRDNERELYKQVATTREDNLKLKVYFLEKLLERAK